MTRELAKQSSLMKLEAMALFAAVKAHIATDRWWYFSEMRRLGRPVRIEQSLSPYRASLHWDYICCGIDCQSYLEREVHQSASGEDRWYLSLSSIEGKDNAQTLHDCLKPLQQQGFYIPNGNENLERQMNFSLGLYGACLMHVDVHFPADRPPLPCFLQVADALETANRQHDVPLATLLQDLDMRRARLSATDDDDNPDIIMGDWQTWK